MKLQNDLRSDLRNDLQNDIQIQNDLIAKYYKNQTETAVKSMEFE